MFIGVGLSAVRMPNLPDLKDGNPTAPAKEAGDRRSNCPHCCDTPMLLDQDFDVHVLPGTAVDALGFHASLRRQQEA